MSSANLLQRGIAILDSKIQQYGDLSDYHRRRLICADAILRVCGCYEGKQLDEVGLAALDMQMNTVAFLAAGDKVTVLAEGVALFNQTARALNLDASDHAYAAVARAVSGGEIEPHHLHDFEHRERMDTSRLAERLRPRSSSLRPVTPTPAPQDEAESEPPASA